MNEDLVEKWSKAPGRRRHEATGVAHVALLPPKLNPRIREYFEQPQADGGHWLLRPEIPTSAEIMDTETSSSSGADVVEIAPNKLKGAFESKDDYLSTHYELLREDAVRPLREAVSMLRFTPAALEDAFDGKIGIYEKVHICGVTLSFKGIAHQVTFSLRRTGKQILWEQSKRLITGSLVALSPASDMFQTKVIIATVASRALAGVQQNPPELQLFFARTEDYEIDPAIEYVMVEARSGFYEAYRHTLLALQHMATEPFPLSEHLVKAERAVPVAKYIDQNPVMDLQSVLINNKHETYDNVDVVKAWPTQPHSDLDASQLEALRRILTKQLAIVQGPPGTGKTHVSVQAIKAMLANRGPEDESPPIIIACQTNHAVDQILRHIAEFEPDFARLGSRSKDQNVIKQRTLYALRKTFSENAPAGSYKNSAQNRIKDLRKEITLILSPLMPEGSGQPLNHRVLENLKILTKSQADSLELGASKWVQHTKSNPNEAKNPFTVWLGDKLIRVPAKQQPEEFGFDFEEADLEFEQLKDIEAENETKEDDDYDNLTGTHVPLADSFTCRKVPGMNDAKVKDALKEQDMWKIPEAYRAAIYRYLQNQMKGMIKGELQEKAKAYAVQAKKLSIGILECNEGTLKTQRIIGMTTTGLSKYRGMISALQPKVVLIEEAAETLEAPVTVACMPSVQQLILVGDHQQLRPHTQVRAHENKPYYLNISMFERLVKNDIEFSTLIKQRRMIPEVRRLLYPIYKNLIQDHKWVLDRANRPDVPGMGGINSFFFTHQWSEARDDQMSSYNPMEADMICGFVEYLHFNGMDLENITILTFYNGQRKRILSSLRQRPNFQGRRFNVVTVDSYQGEENKVVILSMTRSNEKRQIGFLDDINRVCVALSRAQCGFYIFGNGMLFFQVSKTWETVISIMAGKKDKQSAQTLRDPNRLGEKFPIRCHNHDRKMEIKSPDEWEALHGGCDKACGRKLPCGHSCTLTCHAFPHDIVNCQSCQPAPGQTDAMLDVPDTAEPHSRSASKSTNTTSTGSWQEFADQEPRRVAEQMASYRPALQRNDLSDKTRQLSLDGAMDGASRAQVPQGDGTRLRWKETYRSGDESSRVEQQKESRPAQAPKEELLIDFD